MKPIYDANKGQYVLQILDRDYLWVDFFVCKSQSELNSAMRQAACTKDSQGRVGAMRVVHKFMGTTVLS